ncbi:protease modulator HflC [Parvularcula sp. IMCC14364]|uniref:protease modulator HflC n=1 Tax=Parvularcula sp. IMCC14364 TaxID=3067902 RepID=UPI00274190C9|nr:protease modulator HflC [Parvularcula sp. IMCC14364]
MPNIMRGAAIIILAVVVVVGSQTFFTVNEKQQAIVLQLGDPVFTVTEPGLKMKFPFINDVVFVDKRNLEFDMPQAVPIIASNEERLNVDAFIRYEITDPLLYYQSFRQGSANFDNIRRISNQRLSQLLTTNMRNVLGGVRINEIITTRRTELMREIQSRTALQASRFGVEIIDLRIRRADFPDENAARVYDRMKSEYVQEADRLRAEGDEEAKIITSEADKQVITILATAEEEAQKIRGRADAERNAIFADAYNRDPEFFAFYRSLLSYETALKDDETTIILSPDSDFFRYFNNLNGN